MFCVIYRHHDSWDLENEGDCNWGKISTAITLPTELPSDNGHNRKHYTTFQHNKYITAHNGVCFAYRWTENLIHFIVRQSPPSTSLARQYDNDCINVIAPAALKPAVRNYVDLYVPTGLIVSLFLSDTVWFDWQLQTASSRELCTWEEIHRRQWKLHKKMQ